MPFQKGNKLQVGNTNFKGRKHSAETRRKISEANKGRVFSDEWRANLSKAHKGQPSWRKGKIFVPLEEQKRRKLAYRRAWRARNRDRILEQERAYRKKHPEMFRKASREYYRKNRERTLDRIRFNKYGITGDEYRELLGQQQNKCSICLRGIDKNLSVDHDHETGKIRGIICNACNLSIGNAHNSSQRLRAMADYIEQHG